VTDRIFNECFIANLLRSKQASKRIVSYKPVSLAGTLHMWPEMETGAAGSPPAAVHCAMFIAVNVEDSSPASNLHTCTPIAAHYCLFQTHTRMIARTHAWKQNASGCYIGGGIKTRQSNDMATKTLTKHQYSSREILPLPWHTLLAQNKNL